MYRGILQESPYMYQTLGLNLLLLLAEGAWMAEGAERQILKFIVPRSPEMAFSDSSVPLLLDLYYL
jgi:hypothetical protein